MSNTESKFKIDIDDEITLTRGDTVAHEEYGPMHVDQISISSHGKRARLQSDAHEDRLSIELTESKMREQWGDTVALDPFELDSGVTSYENEFESTDGEVQVTISASGPEDRVEPVMCHIHDQTVRVLRAMEERHPPEESKGVYKIDWEGVFEQLAENDRGTEGER